MRLRTKLQMLSIVILTVPALIVVIVAGMEIGRREQDLQLLTLKSVRLELEREFEIFESDFRKDAIMVANLDDVKMLLGDNPGGPGPEELGFKLGSLVLRSKVDTLALYRNSKSASFRWLVAGDNRDLPSTISPTLGLEGGDHVRYQAEPSAIRATTVFPVSLEGRGAGLVYLRRTFDSEWFAAFAYAHKVDFGIRRGGDFIFSSSPALADIPAASLEKGDADSFGFVSGREEYLGATTPIVPGLNGTATAVIAIKNDRLLIEDSRTTTILAGILLFCIIFPAIVFNLVGLRIIGSLSSVAAAAGCLARGDLAYRIKSRRGDEIGDLYDSFNQMALQLEAKEASLNERNRKLALLNAYIGAVFQDLLVSCIAVEADGTVALANESAGVELNIPAGAVGSNLFEIPFFVRHKAIVEALLSRLPEQAEQAAARPDPVDINDPATGKSYTLDVFKAPLEASCGGAIIVVVDISEQRILEEALVRNEKLVAAGQVASALAHDIYNPMSVLLSHIQVLSTRRLPDDEAARFLARMEEEARRIIRLFERLLGTVKADAYLQEPTEINAIIRDMIEVFEIKFKHRGIEASLVEEAGPLKVLTSPEGLKQVLFNLLDNAVQSIERPDGAIVARVGIREGGPAVEILDNGKGIREEDLERIFEPLRPLSPGPGAGFGLGLYFSRRIMRNLGGDLRAASSPGAGSRFTVLFKAGETHGAT
ncbi:MAG TPA: ATP-binding protein [Spirochaetia bacterium]|nr:ATP-binding protein [Spirochaetia bacterium]